MASLGVSAPAASVNSPVAQERTRPAPVESPPALDDGTIVAIFDNANTADTETGKLALKRGHRKEVRQFGAMLARDHAHDGDDVAYWNRYVGVTQVHAHGSFSESRLGITMNNPPEMISSKLGALQACQLSLSALPPPSGDSIRPGPPGGSRCLTGLHRKGLNLTADQKADLVEYLKSP